MATRVHPLDTQAWNMDMAAIDSGDALIASAGAAAAGATAGLDALEVIVETLDRMHGRLADGALCNFLQCRERHAGLRSNTPLRDTLFAQTRHHVVVNIER